jgi:AcrR family transcriptional regulator
MPSIRPHPRVRRTRERILAAARGLLAEAGPAGLTYSLLADRAGVTRQTLYRHWPARAALLVDLILEGPDVGCPPPGADPGVVAIAWLTSLREAFRDQAVRATVLAVTAQADTDPDSAEALIRIADDRAAALNDLLKPSGTHVTSDGYMLLTGPVLTRIFFERREVTDEFIHATVEQWLAVSTLGRDRPVLIPWPWMLAAPSEAEPRLPRAGAVSRWRQRPG